MASTNKAISASFSSRQEVLEDVWHCETRCYQRLVGLNTDRQGYWELLLLGELKVITSNARQQGYLRSRLALFSKSLTRDVYRPLPPPPSWQAIAKARASRPLLGPL